LIAATAVSSPIVPETRMNGGGVSPPFEEFQRAERVESPHRKVAQDDVPLALKRGGEVFRRLHPLQGRFEASPAQLAQHEFRIVGGVLHDQDS
jgi:hypothetical protein